MNGRMNESYFEEKKEYAEKYINDALKEIDNALTILQSKTYIDRSTVQTEEFHDSLQRATALLSGARVDFEKCVWASAVTNKQFDDWLNKNSTKDLIQSTENECRKKHSIKEVAASRIEEAISKAMAEVLGTEHNVTINSIDFNPSGVLGTAGVIPMQISISEKNPFSGNF